jgi:hypothetical protein
MRAVLGGLEIGLEQARRGSRLHKQNRCGWPPTRNLVPTRGLPIAQGASTSNTMLFTQYPPTHPPR